MKLTIKELSEISGIDQSIIEEWIRKGIVWVDSEGLIDTEKLPLKITPEKLKEYGDRVRENFKKILNMLEPDDSFNEVDHHDIIIDPAYSGLHINIFHKD